ncbi:hypothetical protein F511_23945 [Dorcoceras hygrometricum]|uniref:Uncharacterized protein n=1 Tax=Dorcoceras hygrometricum TaxID=472368 RepID=A0A2Z7BMP3_9LAMI|nr:hypothetical protein F511_23945 [Dorcoceras hygrometricum]
MHSFLRNKDFLGVTKYVSKKRSASTVIKDTDEVQVETASPVIKKKRTATGRTGLAEKDLALVSVAQDVVPIQVVEPISVVPAERSHAQKPVETVVVNHEETTSVDNIDDIIEQVIAETAQMEIDVVEPDISEGIAIGTDLAETVVTRSEYIAIDEDDYISGFEQPSTIIDEESLSIDEILKRIPTDMMLPSVTAAETTKIKFGCEISIKGVADGDWYKENLHKIDIADKGKAPLVEAVQMIDEVSAFFNLFSLQRLAALKYVKDIAVKEWHVLTWAETDSVQLALQRRLYIVAKYRELLLRKFLEAHRANFSFGQSWSAMALQIIDLLSVAHSTSMKNLLIQKQALKLEWTRTCCSTLFEGVFDRRSRPIGPVMGDVSVPRRIVDSVSYRIHVIDLVCTDSVRQVDTDSVFVDQRPDSTGSDHFSQGIPDISLHSPHQSPYTYSSMHFNADDTLLGADRAIEQVLIPTTAAPAIDLDEQFAQLRASISQLSIKQMKTQSSIGNLQNNLLSKIDALEKASVDARTQQDQDLRGHFKSVSQEVQIQKTALSFEVLDFNKGVRAQSGIFTTELADICKEIKDQSKEFDDKLAAIRK